MNYTFQVSNDSEASRRVPSDRGEASWETKYEGPVATARDAMDTAHQFAVFYRHVRVFQGQDTNRMWYGIFQM